MDRSPRSFKSPKPPAPKAQCKYRKGQWLGHRTRGMQVPRAKGVFSKESHPLRIPLAGFQFPLVMVTLLWCTVPVQWKADSPRFLEATKMQAIITALRAAAATTAAASFAAAQPFWRSGGHSYGSVFLFSAPTLCTRGTAPL